MVDPVSGSAAEVARQVAEQADAGGGASGVDGADDDAGFDAAMGEAEAVDEVDSVESVEAHGDMEVTGVEELDETGLRDFMDDLGSDRERLDAMLEKCRSGGEMEQRELLELQGLIYGYSQRVEIATKVADKAAGGLKQMMNVRV